MGGVTVVFGVCMCESLLPEQEPEHYRAGEGTFSVTLDAEPLAEPTPSRRRWRRFSLRSFLVFITLVACFFGWVAKERRQSEFERQLGEKLEAQGVVVWYHGPYHHRHSVTTEQGPQQKPQGWWRDLASEVLGEWIEELKYDRLPVSDLTLLAGLMNLKWLWLPGTPISDEEINSLKKALPNCSISRQQQCPR